MLVQLQLPVLHQLIFFFLQLPDEIENYDVQVQHVDVLQYQQANTDKNKTTNTKQNKEQNLCTSN
jgi:hypothetical protein